MRGVFMVVDGGAATRAFLERNFLELLCVAAGGFLFSSQVFWQLCGSNGLLIGLRPFPRPPAAWATSLGACAPSPGLLGLLHPPVVAWGTPRPPCPCHGLLRSRDLPGGVAASHPCAASPPWWPLWPPGVSSLAWSPGRAIPSPEPLHPSMAAVASPCKHNEK
eukprot:Gb_40943 [translate_table: standard]